MSISSGTRIPHFSDPLSSFQGELLGSPQGQPGAADNVASLPLVAPLVAAFRDPVPQTIGSGMTTSQGGSLGLMISGDADLSSLSFGLDITGGVAQRPTIGFFGFAPGSLPFLGGTLLVTPPLQRLAALTLDGSGQASYAPGALPGFAPGEEVYFQAWMLDPANPAGGCAALSNGLRVEFFD